MNAILIGEEMFGVLISVGEKLGGLHLGYRLARLQQDWSFFIIEWAVLGFIVTTTIGNRLSGTTLITVVGELVPIAMLVQWAIVALGFAGKPGYISFLNDALRGKSSGSKGRMPLAEFDTLMRAVAVLGSRITDGHGNGLVAVLRSADPARKGDEALSFSEIGYAIKLKLISDSFAKSLSERKHPFAEFSDMLAGPVSSQEKTANAFIENLLSIYDRLPGGCRLVASISNPDSIAVRLRQWQFTATRIGLIAAVVVALASIAAVFI